MEFVDSESIFLQQKKNNSSLRYFFSSSQKVSITSPRPTSPSAEHFPNTSMKMSSQEPGVFPVDYKNDSIKRQSECDRSWSTPAAN